jgi:putative ABC transport system permease protein
VAVLSLTAVGFFTSRISQGVRAQAAEVLAADLRLESPNAHPAALLRRGAAPAASTSARILSFPTAIFNGDVSQLAALNAVTANYPLRGHVRIADAPFGAAATPTSTRPRRGLDRRAHHRAAEVSARRLAAHRRSVVSRDAGARLSAGSGHGLRESGSRRADQLRRRRATQLIQPGSRVTYCGAVRGAARGGRRVSRIPESTKAPGERLRDVDESSRQLNSAIDRASRFLNLASLASVLLAAVAVVMGARRYAARHIDTVALMKCMGARRLRACDLHHRIDAAGAVRGAIGALLGYLAQWGLAWLLRDLIRTELPPASLAPLPIALVTVLAMLIGFALPPLLQLKNTPPARVLRKTVSAPPLRYGLSYLLALARCSRFFGAWCATPSWC